MTTKLIIAESARHLLTVTAKEEEKKQWNTSNECNTFSQKHFGIFCQFSSSSSCNFILRLTLRKDNHNRELHEIYFWNIYFLSNKKQNESLI